MPIKMKSFRTHIFFTVCTFNNVRMCTSSLKTLKFYDYAANSTFFEKGFFANFIDFKYLRGNFSEYRKEWLFCRIHYLREKIQISDKLKLALKIFGYTKEVRQIPKIWIFSPSVEHQTKHVWTCQEHCFQYAPNLPLHYIFRLN